MSEQFDGIFIELAKAGYFKTIKDTNQSLSTKIQNSEKGSPNGVAPLDQNRLIPAIYLPSYVDDVLEFTSKNVFPVQGESGKIYVALDSNKTFRWSGSSYVEISASPGSTDSIPEGTVNLYFTDARARAAVTTISGNAATATKLQTPRTIYLSGDVGGTVTFDGGSNVTMVTTVGDDSHRHSLSTIDGLGTVATYNVPTSGNNASTGQVVLGNDTRLSDPRPASDVSSWAKASVKPSYTAAEVGAQPLNSNLTSIGSISGNGVLGRDSLGAWSFSDGIETAFSTVPRIYLGSSEDDGINCDYLGYGVAVVRIGSNSSYNLNKPQFNVKEAAYAYIQTIRGFDAQSGNGKIQIAWPLNSLISTGNPETAVMAFRSVASNSITMPDWNFIVCNMATTSDYGYMTTSQVAALNTAVSNISALQTSKEPTIGTLSVSKGGTGVNSLSGVGYFNGTSPITAATSDQIRSLIGTSTTLMTGLNADLLDGNHASAFALSGHGHSIASTTADGFMSSSQVTSLNTAVSNISTLQSSKENAFTILPVSKGGSGVNSLSGVGYFNGTSPITAATSADIVALVPDATTSQSGKMTTSQVSSLNKLGGLVSMGSGVVKKTTSTTGLDTYSTAVIADLVTSTNPVTNLNADMLDGYHVNNARVTASAHIPYVGSDGVIELGKYIDFHPVLGNDFDLRLEANQVTTSQSADLRVSGGRTASAKVWHSDNHGATSGLDADLLDGIDSTGFLRSNAATMFTGNNLTMATNLKYTPSASLTTQGIVTYGVQDDTNFCRLRTYGRDASNAITGARLGWSTGTRYINIDTKPDPILSAYDCINIYPTTTSAQVALRIDGNLVWHDGNDGPGSGLNADLIDNIQGSVLVRNDITNQELKGFSLGAPAGTSLSNGIVFNRGLDNDSGWALKSSGTGTSPTFVLVDTFTDALLRPRYEWTNTAYYPTTTNTISLGSSSSKWTVVYATTGTINTSDARMKTQVEQFTQNELMASKLLADEIGLYKFLDSISTKGDQARRHVGMTVQRAIEIMTKCGLEPFDYGFICYDEWVDDAGETQSQYAFRYDQLNMFIIRGLSERISALEAR